MTPTTHCPKCDTPLHQTATKQQPAPLNSYYAVVTLTCPACPHEEDHWTLYHRTTPWPQAAAYTGASD